jgi:hypothetical protein
MDAQLALGAAVALAATIKADVYVHDHSIEADLCILNGKINIHINININFPTAPPELPRSAGGSADSSHLLPASFFAGAEPR